MTYSAILVRLSPYFWTALRLYPLCAVKLESQGALTTSYAHRQARNLRTNDGSSKFPLPLPRFRFPYHYEAFDLRTLGAFSTG